MLINDRNIEHINSSDVGVVICHGYSSTRQSMGYLTNKILASQNHSVIEITLPGHDNTYSEMKDTKMSDWIEYVEYTILRLKAIGCKKVFFVGLSMGGSLGLLASINYKLSGVIAINHAYYYTDWRAYLFYWIPFLHWFIKENKSTGQDIKDPAAHEVFYNPCWTKSLRELTRVMYTLRNNIKKIKCPVLIIKSKDDHVIKYESGKDTVDALVCSDKTYVEVINSYHIATLDYDKDIIADSVISFINNRK